jgi:glucose-6-phosphate-specific signal transduction histidine kinase
VPIPALIGPSVARNPTSRSSAVKEPVGTRPIAVVWNAAKLIIGGGITMTDIFSSASQFVLWLCVLLASKYRWRRSVQFVVFGAVAVLMIWQFISPVEIDIQSRIGRPLNMVLRLSTIGLTLWFLLGVGRREPRDTI